MSTPGDREREDLALDALIALAFLQVDDGQLPDLAQPEPELLPDDEAALAALPPDLVDRIVDDEWAPRSRPQKQSHRDLAVALNRSEDGDELTDKAREEMERRLRDLEAEEAKNLEQDANDADDRIPD